MNNLDRIANYLDYKTWDDLIEYAKENDVEFKIPNYFHYGKYGEDFCNRILFDTIKNINFKLTFDDYKVYLTRDKVSDIIEPTIYNKEETS